MVGLATLSRRKFLGIFSREDVAQSRPRHTPLTDWIQEDSCRPSLPDQMSNSGVAISTEEASAAASAPASSWSPECVVLSSDTETITPHESVAQAANVLPTPHLLDSDGLA